MVRSGVARPGPAHRLAGRLAGVQDCHRGGRTIAAAVAIAAAITGGIIGGPSHLVLADLIFEAIVIVAIMALTASGFGSILSWTARTTLSHLTAIGSLIVR